MFRTYYNTYKNTSFAYNSYIIRQFPQKVWLQGKQLRPLASLIRIRLKAESLNLVNKFKAHTFNGENLFQQILFLSLYMDDKIRLSKKFIWKRLLFNKFSLVKYRIFTFGSTTACSY